MNFGEPMAFDINHDFPFIKLHVVFGGTFHFEPESARGVAITIEEGQFNFFYMPEVQGKLHLLTNQVSSVDIECDESFFKRLFKNELFKISGSFGEAMQNQQPFRMFDESRPIDESLRMRVEDIVQHSQASDVDIIHIETQLSAIFRSFFAELRNPDVPKKQEALKIEELDQVRQAEEILRNHLRETITVDELAAEVGTNRHKLNRNFKRVYNEPIFTYLTRLRMTEAKSMLMKRHMNVSEVADSVGYKNPQHFTTAFKKHFGYVPSKLTNLEVYRKPA